jgi:hypothetical protein
MRPGSTHRKKIEKKNEAQSPTISKLKDEIKKNNSIKKRFKEKQIAIKRIKIKNNIKELIKHDEKTNARREKKERMRKKIMGRRPHIHYIPPRLKALLGPFK